ncbi:MAG: NAD(P)-dependent alcohol dehydrogenase [Phototrophicales bacterium]|nr:MAG: NAD(P)-dependent alcohol dehydrogenase [Phototrophicales bacterium]
MKAIVHHQYGTPEVLHVAEVETPHPKANEVLVRIHATPVNFGDLLARRINSVSPRQFSMPTILWFITRLTFGWRKPRNPILGSEFGGEIVAIGEDVTRFKVGDLVFGYRSMNMRANAEYLSVKEDSLIAPKPENMTTEEASTLPYGTLTALNLLRRVGIQPKQKVLILGASGSIGAAALQLAKHYGAEVTGVASGPRLEMMKALGADHVIDYTQEDFTQNGETYDLIVDILNKHSFAKVKHSLSANGRYLLASFKMKQVWQMIFTGLFGKKKVVCALSQEDLDDLFHVKELAEAGTIKPHIDRRFPMAQAADAHRYAESRQKRGVVLITYA